MSWWFKLVVQKHVHTLVKDDSIGTVTKKVPVYGVACYRIYESYYRQSICIECGERISYDLIKTKYIHTVNYDGTKIIKDKKC